MVLDCCSAPTAPSPPPSGLSTQNTGTNTHRSGTQWEGVPRRPRLCDAAKRRGFSLLFRVYC